PSAPVTMRLARYSLLSGRITGPGGRAPGRAAIAIFTRISEGGELSPLLQESAAADGSFSIELRPGEYAAGVWYNSAQDGVGLQLYPDNVHPEFFSVRSGETRAIQFGIPPAEKFGISGKVEQPQPGTQYLLTLAVAGQYALPLLQVRTAPDGSFRMEGVRPGVYDVLAAAEVGTGSQPRFGQARIRVTDQNVEGVNLAMDSGRTVQLVLRGKRPPEKAPAGCPASTKVWLVPVEFQGAGARAVEANFAKAETAAGLPPGRLRVRLPELGMDCYQASAPLLDLTRESRETVEVELASTGSIRGELKSVTALSGNFVVVLTGLDSTRMAFADERGRFAFQGLPPGAYRIGARTTDATSNASWFQDVNGLSPIEVMGGGTIEMELPVPQKKEVVSR
ncbi:MAG: hypothetical protein JWP63_4996, partial [Candidatus Solibacter sp.]|nr:hypothetical protein [Candidatus Solibacter sp.]